LVKIRLKRMGAKKRPFYRLVVADSRSPRDGRFIELLGFYDPLPNPAKVQIDADKVREWIGKGARPSDAARALLVEQGILAKVPRAFKPAPEPKAAAGASETPGASEEVDAVPAEAADRPVTVPVAQEQPDDAPAAADKAEPAPDATEAEAAP
jgi:small subunit ribosomal protein S16